MARRNDPYAALGALVGRQLAARQAQGIGATAGAQAASQTAPAGSLGGQVGQRAAFMQALGTDIPGYDIGDQARAYAAAGAPNISAEFAQRVANGDPEVLGFIDLLKQRQGRPFSPSWY